MKTYEQVKRNCTAKANKYLKELGYNTVKISCTRGIFHLTNGHQYFLSASNVLSQATGLIFNPLNAYMCKLDKTQFN